MIIFKAAKRKEQYILSYICPMAERIEISNKKALRTFSKPADMSSIGKLPPQALELEEAVLGALMLEKAPLNDVIDIIHRPEIFYKDAHKKIYESIQELFSRTI